MCLPTYSSFTHAYHHHVWSIQSIGRQPRRSFVVRNHWKPYAPRRHHHARIYFNRNWIIDQPTQGMSSDQLSLHFYRKARMKMDLSPTQKANIRKRLKAADDVVMKIQQSGVECNALV